MITYSAALVLLCRPAYAQSADQHAGGLYVSWGYNAESYAKTDLHLVQPSLGTDVTMRDLAAHDNKGWPEFLKHQLTVPQYSVRIGYFLPNTRDWAVEVSFEHARYIATQLQHVRLTGTLEGAPVDSNVQITRSLLTYWMNNGANFLLFNVVKAKALRGERGHTGSISILGKAGAGVLFPHAQNTVFGRRNTPGYQFGGLDAGLELALRVHAYRRLYVEFGEKGVYGRYRGIKIAEGTADLDVWAHTTSLSLGWSFSGVH